MGEIEGLFDPEDREEEMEDDSWFDQLVEVGLSCEDLDSQPPVSDGQIYDPVPDTAIDFDMQSLFSPSKEVLAFLEDSQAVSLDKDGMETDARPVARSLARDDPVINIEDSPRVKCEELTSSLPPPGLGSKPALEGSNSRDRDKHIEEIKKKLRLLEEQIHKVEPEA